MNKKIKFQISGIDQALSGQYIRVEDPSTTPRAILHESDTLYVDSEGNVEMDLGDVGEVGLKVIYHCDSHPKDGLSFGYVTGSTVVLEVVDESSIPVPGAGGFIVRPLTTYYNFNLPDSWVNTPYVRIPPLTVNPGETISFQLQLAAGSLTIASQSFITKWRDYGWNDAGSVWTDVRLTIDKTGKLLWVPEVWILEIDDVVQEPGINNNNPFYPDDGLPHIIKLTAATGALGPNIIDVIGSHTKTVGVQTRLTQSMTDGTIGFFDSTQTSDSRYYAMDEGYSADGTGAVIDEISGNNGDAVNMVEENWITV